MRERRRLIDRVLPRPDKLSKQNQGNPTRDLLARLFREAAHVAALRELVSGPHRAPKPACAFFAKLSRVPGPRSNPTGFRTAGLAKVKLLRRSRDSLHTAYRRPGDLRERNR